MELLLDALTTTARQAVIFFGPLAAAVALLHVLERLLAARLQSRLGWRSVWLTGWLGVPLHELSHAAACVVFGHRVERLSLFSPDAQTGRLGSVQHAWDRRNLYQQVGRFFIGIAPLLGGVAVLLILTRLLGPPGLGTPVAGAEGGLGEAFREAGRRASELVSALAGADTAGRGRTWLYLYLCLCVGAHMAPSSTDLKGGALGLALALAALLLLNLVVALCGGRLDALESLALAAVAPLLVLLLLALILGVGFLLVVVLLTAPLPERAV